jgi:hypothetical protein
MTSSWNARMTGDALMEEIMPRSDERGVAIVMAMFMTLIVSALAASMAFVARTETLSSQSYTTMAQARYAAESGLAAATNYLLSSQYPLPILPDADFDITVSPVLRSGADVTLSTEPDTSNYPVATVVEAFGNAASGTLGVSNGNVQYGARARLLAMRQLNDAMSGQNRTLQTWEITGVGRRGGSGSAEVEVTAIIERQTRPVFSYAAFAGYNGCSALAFSGSSRTSSYNSSVSVPAGETPVLTNSDGHVGTNGNLSEIGDATINGTLSTPRTGVGACTAGNVTAQTIIGENATVTGGLVQLPQVVEYPDPGWPDPTALTTNQAINGPSCPSGYAAECSVAGGQVVFAPTPGTPLQLGNVSLLGNAVVNLQGGTYIMNSLSVSAGSRIVVEPGTGPVRILLDGRTGLHASAPVLNVSGYGIANTTWDPNHLRIEYNGERTIAMDGTGNTAAIIYAPNASASFSGTADLYGAIVVNTLAASGEFGIHYDVRLRNSTLTAGNPVMNSFTWRTF